MHMKPLGRTGLFVSELCLGTMTFGGTGEIWSKIGDLGQADADRFVARSFDAGINFFDTADVYSNGLSEEITGRALAASGRARHEYVLATKAYGGMGTGANAGGNTRLHLIEACKASLKRLQLDHIDLYQLHGFDPATPIEETLRALDTLVQHGHVRHVGVSNWAAWQIAKALGISERLNLARFESLQAYYTVAGRDLERELAPMLASEGVGLMVWSPLAGGFLSGKHARGERPTAGSRRAGFQFPPLDEALAFDCIDAMRPIAEAHGVSVSQIALSWLLHRKVVTSVIIGAKRMEQLEDNLAAAAIDLTPDELDRLDAAGAPSPEYPAWMMARQSVRADLLHRTRKARPDAR